MSRTDTHAPKNFDPADYVVVGYIDNKRPEYYPGLPIEVYEEIDARWRAEIEKYFPGFRTGGTDHTSIHQCNHCGHPGIRWVSVVKHVPTGALLAFGTDCADRCELGGRDEFKLRFLKDKAQKEAERMEREAARAKFAADNAAVVEFLTGLNSDYDSREPEFLLSLKAQLASKGSLSERQVEAAAKFMVKRAERAARVEAEKAAVTGELPTGRVTITGEIVSTKVQDSDFGRQFKMLVKLENGTKVWGTVPRSLEDLTFSSIEEDGTVTDGIELRGTTVEFTATVERSRDDETFGFYKRPTGAKVVVAAA